MIDSSLPLPPKTRFAPSPTGFMHFGNARTALFNYLYAKHLGGSCLLRIEDTDKLRSEETFVTGILEDLAWMDIGWEGDPNHGHQPYRQSMRDADYQFYYDKLADLSRVYDCFCTEQELAISRKAQLNSGRPPRYAGTCRHLTDKEREMKREVLAAKGLQPALRFLVKPGETFIFEDMIKGPQKFLSDDIGDFIIRRGTGGAAFFFCNAIDDALMGVTHALRGEDHLSNTPRQLMILETLGLRCPQYGHFPTILGQDGGKLAKRNGSRSIQDLREEGYHPLGILNYMARLGHHYTSHDFLSLEQLGEHFHLKHISLSPARFDDTQLDFWQKEAMHKMPPSEFFDFVQCELKDKPQWQAMTKAFDARAFAALIQPNILFPKNQTLDWIRDLCGEQVNLTEEVKQAILEGGADLFDSAIKHLKASPGHLNYSEWIKKIQADTGIKGKKLFMAIRAALTRRLSGPELDKVLTFLGTQRAIERLEHLKFGVFL